MLYVINPNNLVLWLINPFVPWRIESVTQTQSQNQLELNNQLQHNSGIIAFLIRKSIAMEVEQVAHCLLYI